MIMTRVTWILAVLTHISQTVLSTADSPPSGPTTTTPGGPLVGTYTMTRGGRAISAFRGIPFAKPPLGALRFQPPVPMESWNDTLYATTQPPACIQFIDPYSREDCLYLNVFTPRASQLDSQPLLPVIFFIPGGSSEMGSAHQFTPEYLLDRDVLLVVTQYRVGFFGFFTTGDEVVPGNMAFKDLRCALRWVRDNIKSFGGDPEKVTISGESSGAAFVHFLMTFVAEEGLFRAAIIQSGSALDPWAFRPPNEVQKMVLLVAQHSGCPTDSSGLVNCLRQMSDRQLMALYSIFYKNSVYTELITLTSQTLPLLGGVIEPECVEDRIVTGNPWHVNTSIPWIAGVTSKESLYIFLLPIYDPTGFMFKAYDSTFERDFASALNYPSSSADGNFSSALRSFYLKDQPVSRRTLSQSIDMYSDPLFIYGVYEAVLRSNPSHTFMYYYDYRVTNQLYPVPTYARIGACHTDDMWMFFPHPYLEENFIGRQQETAEDIRLSEAMITLLTNFVTYLDPTPEGSSFRWTPFYPNNSYLNVTQEGTIKMDSGFLKERMDFWQSHPFPFRDDYYDPIPCMRT